MHPGERARLPMRHVSSLILCTMLLLPAVARAQDYGSSDYSIERWDEDYSYLKNPASRSDFFDPLKYVPLDKSGDSYLTFAGQARERYDYFQNTQFGAGPQSHAGFELTRLLLSADAHFGPNFRAFLQLDSSLKYDRAGGPRTGDVKDFDFQQAFADILLPLNNADSVVIRVGRQELIYGAQRLISPNDWANVRTAFDGAKASFSFPNDTLDLFLVRPVQIQKEGLNGEDDRTAFAGIYNVLALPRLIPSAHSKLDLYLLALSKRGSSDQSPGSDTYTLGLRFHANPAPWDFDIEPDWQFGRTDTGGISAWSVASEAGYTFSRSPFTPRASLGLDLASGSANGKHRFNELFPPQYLFLGHMYVLGRENLIDLHAGLEVDVTRNITLNIDQHFFWRQNVHDAIYNLTGGVVRASGASHAAYIGNELDAVFNWQIQRHVSAYLGYAHFFTGPFIQNTGAHADIDFIYTAVTFTF